MRPASPSVSGAVVKNEKIFETEDELYNKFIEAYEQENFAVCRQIYLAYSKDYTDEYHREVKPKKLLELKKKSNGGKKQDNDFLPLDDEIFDMFNDIYDRLPYAHKIFGTRPTINITTEQKVTKTKNPYYSSKKPIPKCKEYLEDVEEKHFIGWDADLSLFKITEFSAEFSLEDYFVKLKPKVSERAQIKIDLPYVPTIDSSPNSKPVDMFLKIPNFFLNKQKEIKMKEYADAIPNDEKDVIILAIDNHLHVGVYIEDNYDSYIQQRMSDSSDDGSDEDIISDDKTGYNFFVSIIKEICTFDPMHRVKFSVLFNQFRVNCDDPVTVTEFQNYMENMLYDFPITKSYEHNACFFNGLKLK